MVSSCTLSRKFRSGTAKLCLADLGTINTLHRTKSGKLAASRPNTAKGNSVPAFSPRVLLESAIDDPAQLQRLKFHVEEQKVSAERHPTKEKA